MLNWTHSEAHLRDMQRTAERERLIREALEAKKDEEKRSRDAARNSRSNR